MDEEEKLPLFGVQPNNLQNIETGFGSLSENPQAQNALIGEFSSLPVLQARHQPEQYSDGSGGSRWTPRGSPHD
jgi:hypothetical protein